MVTIRPEQPDDPAAIREIHRRAFGQEQEGAIVDALRTHGAVILSLVAALDDRLVGHVLYSPVKVGDIVGAGLGPMAVVPECQRQGIGSRLVEDGNEQLRQAGCPFIVVVGHPAFYPRFGFGPASACGLFCEWPVPDDVFMALPLDRARMRGTTGLVTYRAEFSTVS